MSRGVETAVGGQRLIAAAQGPNWTKSLQHP